MSTSITTRIRNAQSGDPSAAVLLAANAVPLIGVLSLHWQVFPVILLYWLENLVTGVFNIARLAWVPVRGPSAWATKIFLIPVFCAHYGFFCFCHGAAVFFFFGDRRLSETSVMLPLIMPAIRRYGLEGSLLAMVFSHGFSFVTNYLRGGEYRHVTLRQVMLQPYRRVVVLHLTILASGIALWWFRSPVNEIGLVLLIALKTAMDLLGHRAERKKFSPSAD